MLTRCASLIALSLLFFVAAPALAGPGSGAAVILPPGNVSAGTAGTWSVVYTASEQFSGGIVSVDIPSGWTAPQTAQPTSPGYVSVSTDAPSGNPAATIVGNTIRVAVDTLDVGLTLTIAYGDDNGGANPSAVAAAATVPGSYEFTVRSHPTSNPVAPIGTSPSVVVTAAAPAQLAFIPGDPTITAGDYQQFTLAVEDEFGSRTPVSQSRTIGLFKSSGAFYLPGDHGTPITQVIIPASDDSVRIDYRATMASGGSQYELDAVATDGLSPFLGGVGYVAVDPAAVDADHSTIVATSPVVADGSTQSSVTVTSRDVYDNVRAGDNVTIAPDGNAVPVQPPLQTDAAGEATGVVTDATAETVTVSATIDGTLITDTATIDFVPGAPDAGTTTVDAVSPVIANGVSTSTVTVTVRDASGNPVAGQNVTLDVTPAGAGLVVNQPGGVTDAAGVITGSIASTTTGVRVINAIVDTVVSVVDDASVTFDPGSLASFEVLVDGLATAGVYDTVRVTARDAQGNVVTGYTGTVDLSSTTGDPSIDWGSSFAQGDVINGAGDAATYNFVLADNGWARLSVKNEKAQTYRVDVVDGAVSAQSADIVNNHAAPSQIVAIAGDEQNATVNTSVSTAPAVRVTDAYDNPVDGATVTFGPRTAGSSVDVTAGGGADSTGTTDASGEIACDVWTLSTVAGSNKLRAYLGAGSPNVDFTATGDPGAGASLVIAPGTKNVTVSQSETVTLTLKDAFNNVVPGERIDVAITDAPNGSLAANPGDPNPTTRINDFAFYGDSDANGRISVLYNAPGTAGVSDVIDGSTSTVPQGSVTDAVYTTTASGGTNLRITFVSASTVAAGSTFEFLVEAVDGGGNVDTGNNSTVDLTPQSGSTLAFSESDFGATVTQVTLSSGAATVYGQGTRAGTWNFDVSGGGLAGDSDAVTITDTGVIHHYAVTTVDSVAAGTSFNVAVQARDEFDNLVVGASNTVDLAAVLASDSTTLTVETLSVTQTPLVSGQANVGEVYTKARTIRVRARDASVREGFSGAVKVNAAEAKRIVVVSGDGATVEAGAGQALTVEVRDTYSNPVQGESVTFAATAGGGSIPSPVVTGADGRATSTLTTGTTVATNTVSATILGGNPPDEKVVFTVQTIAGPIASYVVTPAATTVTAGVSLGLTVTAKDANNNTRTQDSSTIVALSSDTGHMQFTASSGALTAGVFSTTMFDNTAEGVVVSAQNQGGGPSGSTGTITVNPAAAKKIVYVSGNASGLQPLDRQALVAEVRDQFDNPVLSGTAITFQITSAPGPGAAFRDAVGDTTDGITATNASGQGTVDLLTSATAGTHTVKATILDGNPPADETTTFTVTTVATGIDHYTVELGATETTAGSPVTVTVTAYDAQDNPVTGDNTTQVTLARGGTGTGPPNFDSATGTLTAGVFQTNASPTTAEDITFMAFTSGSPGTSGESAVLTVVPAAPSGDITATANDTTITATTLSTTTINSGVVRDQYGNAVAPGELVKVAATNDRVTFDSDDQYPATTELDRAVGSDGRFNVKVRSGTEPGPELITFASVNGDATGSVPLTLAQPVAFETTSPPDPDVVFVGDAVSFSIPVHNTSTTGATLNVGTSVTFSDGTHNFSAPLPSQRSIAAGATDTLVFATRTVDAAMTPGFYTPTVNLSGRDFWDSPFSRSSSLPAQSLLVTAVEITAISAPPLVSRGTTDTVSVTIENKGSTTATITDVDANIGADFTSLDPPAAPLDLLAGQSTVVKVPVSIGVSTPLTTYSIDAAAYGTVGGKAFSDPSVAPYPTASWTVQANAQLRYVGGTLAPDMATRGQSYALSVGIENEGGATVTLDETTSRVEFTDGSATYSALLPQAAAIAGNMTQTLPFNSATVPAGMAEGSYPVSLYLYGTENGVPFADTLVTSDLITVERPAVIVEATPNSLSPDRVSIGQSVQFKVNLTNTGGASVVLDPAATTISFGVLFSTTLAAGVTTLDPGTSQLTFVTEPIPAGLGTGPYNPTVHVQGTSNGFPFSTNVPLADSVVVDKAPNFAILDINPSQPKFTANQGTPIQVRMVVQNNGGAVDFDHASLSLRLGATSTTSQFNISTVTGFQLDGASLAGGGAVDTLLFTVGDSPGSMSTGLMTIEGSVTVIDQNSGDPITTDPATSGQGELLVQTPGALQLVDLIPSQTTVTQNMTKPVAMDLVVRNTGQSDLQLDLTAAATMLTFDAPAGWTWTLDPALAGGGTVLAGAVTDTVAFTITHSGSVAVPTGVSVMVSATEINSGTARNQGGTSLETLIVQAPAVFAVTNVSASRGTITNGSNVDWTITVDVANAGGANAADLELMLPSTFNIDFGASTPPGYAKPTALDGDGVVLHGGNAGTLTIPIPDAGTYASLGPKIITAGLAAIEVNSDSIRVDSDTTLVTVQELPAPGYVNASLYPDTVSLGQNTSFSLEVTNPTTNGATVEVTGATLAFDGNAFVAALTPGTYDIVAGATEILSFQSATVPPGAPLGQQNDVTLSLSWMDNGRAHNDVYPVPASDLFVQDVPNLGIQAIYAGDGRSSVTAGVQAPWRIVMVVTNSGETAVDIDPAQASTFLTLKTLGGATVTNQYGISQPTALEAAGDLRLDGFATDSLVFDINTTGSTTGTIVISGRVEGQNVLTSDILSDVSQGGSFTVQSPAGLAVLAIVPDRTMATVSQTTPYQIKAAVKNTGGATITLDMVRDSTDLVFDPPSGWIWTLQPALAGGGTSLPGGVTDSLVFTVNTTGSTESVTNIGARVSGDENNTGTHLVATAPTGTGTITLQNGATVVADNVQPSRDFITQGSGADWSITLSLRNAGTANAQLILPTGVSLAIQDATGGTTLGTVNGVEEGGTMVPGGTTRTLVIPVTNTGTFSSLGAKTATAKVRYVDVNTGVVDSVMAAFPITAQSAPDLQYVPLSLVPSSATTGKVVPFSLQVTNGNANSATAHLNVGQTRFYFSTYSAFLSTTSVDSIAGGETVTLDFEERPLTSPERSYDANLDLYYNYNGESKAVTRPISGELTVTAAPSLQIVSMQVSQTTVSALMTKTWTVTMLVRNNGSNSVDLDVSSAVTKLTFNKAGVTGALPGYVVTQPTGLNGTTQVNLGPSGAEGNLIFTVTGTGPDTGSITVNGRVEGQDTGSSDRPSDDTFDGGAASVTVQTAANLVVDGIFNRATVTAGQAAPWTAKVAVRNAGEATAQLFLDADSTDISFGADDANWTAGPPTVMGGDDLIAGGEVDTLQFSVTQSGTASPSRRIDAVVHGFDVNSDSTVSDTTDASGFGSIIVQTPPSLRMTSTVIPVTASTPNAPTVNTSQAFGVAVSVTNDGQATASNVSFSMVHGGGSAMGTPPPPIASVPAGSTRVYTMPWTAPGSPQSDTFTARFAGALDANTNQSDQLSFSFDDSTATATIVAPAALGVVRVDPSQTTVTRGQSANWDLTVVVTNTGSAPAVLAAPAPADVAFKFGGSPSTGYAVIAPTQFASGAAGWTLAAGATDSLVYTVDDTGNDAGTIDIEVTLDYTDGNNPAAPAQNALGQGTVDVQNPAGLVIVGTQSQNTPNVVNNTAIVNTGQNYQIEVTVQNSGSGEGVDEVHVNLSSNGNSVISLASADSISINANAQGTFTFNVTAGSVNALEEFTAVITHAVSQNTGDPVTPGSATDPTQLVTVQTRADLAVTTFDITSPPGAVDDSVSTNQTFTVRARVDNLGQASVTGTAQLTLTPPPNFTLPGLDPVKAFTPGADVTWSVKAPNAPQDAADMKVKITAVPNDANIAAQAYTSLDSVLKAVTVLPGGDLQDDGTAIASPAGATDGVLSTQQTFTVGAHVYASINARDVTATLDVPAGFNAVGSTVRNLGNGADTTIDEDFNVIAPSSAAAVDTIHVTFSGTDINTTAPLTPVTVAIPVEVVPRTRLTLSADVTAPPDAIDRTVTIGTPFTIEATVANVAGGAGISGTAELTITVPTAQGYALQAGEQPTKLFTLGTPVSWVVVAAPQPSGPDDIVINISTVPNDENSEAEAVVVTGQASVPMNTGDTSIEVTDVTAASGISNAVVPAGTPAVDLLAFDMAYTADQGADARIDTIAVTILGADGRPMSAGTVRRTIRGLHVRLGSATAVAAAATNTNPVIVDFSGTGSERFIAPGDTQTAVVGIDVASNPSAKELRVQVRGGGLIVVDTGSDQPLGVVDDATGQGLDGRLTSAPLVILSNNFEEYVHNYPNPFRAGSEVTKIAYFLDRPGEVSMSVYTMGGDLVYERTLPGGDAGTTAGPHEMEWDGRNGQGEVIRNGVYVCVLKAGGNSATFRIAVAK